MRTSSKTPIVEIKGKQKRTTVQFVPPETEIHIKDYDTSKYGEDSLEPDENKKMCKYTVWGNAATDPKKEITVINLIMKNERLKNKSKTPVIVREFKKTSNEYDEYVLGKD